MKGTGKVKHELDKKRNGTKVELGAWSSKESSEEEKRVLSR